MKIYVVSCTECPFVNRNTRLQYARVAFTKHSCERQIAIADSHRRNAVRYDHIDRTPQPCLHKQANHQHGDRTTYVLDRCRCLPCAKANSDHEQNRVRQQAYGRWDALVDAEPVRAHLRLLQSHGMGYKRVARKAGVGLTTLSGLYYGKRGVEVKRVRKEVAEKVLAVPLPRWEDLGSKVSVDAVGTVRRLRALVANGWSIQRLSEQPGMEGWSGSNLHVLVTRSDRTSAKTAIQVRSLYERLENVPAPEYDQHSRQAASRARNLARKRLWLAPVWWDEDTIDDPSYVPETEFQTRGRTNEIRSEESEFLRENGMTLHFILIKLDCSWEALNKSYARAGVKWPWSHKKPREMTA